MEVLLLSVWLAFSIFAGASISSQSSDARVSAFLEALSVALPLYLVAGTSVALLIQLTRSADVTGTALVWLSAVLALVWSTRVSGWQIAANLLLFAWMVSLGLPAD